MKAAIISILTAVVLAVAGLSWVMMHPARSLTVHVLGSKPEFGEMLASSPRELRDFRIYRSSSSGMWMFSTVAGSAAEADRRIDGLEGFLLAWEASVTAGHWVRPLVIGERIDGHWDCIARRHDKGWKYEPYP